MSNVSVATRSHGLSSALCGMHRHEICKSPVGVHAVAARHVMEARMLLCRAALQPLTRGSLVPLCALAMEDPAALLAGLPRLYAERRGGGPSTTGPSSVGGGGRLDGGGTRGWPAGGSSSQRYSAEGSALMQWVMSVALVAAAPSKPSSVERARNGTARTRRRHTHGHPLQYMYYNVSPRPCCRAAPPTPCVLR